MRTLALKLFSLVSVFLCLLTFHRCIDSDQGQLDHSTTKEEANMSVSREFSKLNLIWKDWASTKLIAKLLLRLNWKTREVLKSAYSSEFHRPPDHDQLQRIPIISDKMLKENDRQSEQRQFQITPRSRSTSAHSDSNGSLNRTKYSVTASTQSLQNISSLL